MQAYIKTRDISFKLGSELRIQRLQSAIERPVHRQLSYGCDNITAAGMYESSLH